MSSLRLLPSRSASAPRILGALVACVALALAALLAMPPSARAATPLETALRAVMDASATAWSNGKLDDFMTIYEDSPDIRYISGGKVVGGYAAIRAMYAERFTGSTPGALGALSFELIETRPLGTDHALLVGRYRLKPAQADKPEATGLFTLLFHRSQGRWRVINDHTS